MAIRKILVIPDPVLRQSCAPVERIDDSIRALVADMFETMYDAPGIGLAAPQIGVRQRIAVVDVSGKEEPPHPIALINPEITWTSEEQSVFEEGCLSIPDYYEEVIRPAKCRVRFRDEHGAEREIEAEDLLSTCLQHEIDHLNGTLFIDHISKLKRDRVVKRFTKAAKRDATEAAEPVKRTPRVRKYDRPMPVEAAAAPEPD